MALKWSLAIGAVLFALSCIFPGGSLPRINHPTLGDVVATQYLTGTIIAVDTANDTCSVQGTWGGADNIPIFYHCNPDAEIRDNGALVGGAAAFGVDDEVIVLMQENVVLYVVGFVDGIKSCGFRIKLTRDDGIVMTDDPDDDFDVEFEIYDSSNALVYETGETGNKLNIVFDPSSQYWIITISDPEYVVDPNGYWINYHANDALWTQYPYRWKLSDKLNVDDLLPLSGAYQDNLPYYRTTGVIIFDDPEYRSAFPHQGFIFSQPFTRRVSVWSSVPYRIRYVTNSIALYVGFSGFGRTGEVRYPDFPLTDWFAGVICSIVGGPINDSIIGTVAYEGQNVTVNQSADITGRTFELTLSVAAPAGYSYCIIYYPVANISFLTNLQALPGV